MAGVVAATPTRLEVGGDYAFAPYSFIENGRPAGIDVDLMRELSRRTGVELHVHLQPFKRVLEELRQGRLDAGMAVLHSTEREAFLQYTGVLRLSRYQLFVRRGQEFPFERAEDLRGRSVAVVRGFLVGDTLREELSSARVRLESVASQEQTLRMLLAGRVDAIAGQSVVMRHLAREQGAAGRLSALPTPVIPDRPAYLVLSRRGGLAERDRLAELLCQGLESMHRDGTVERIEGRWIK